MTTSQKAYVPTKPWRIENTILVDKNGYRLIEWPVGMPEEFRQELAQHIINAVNADAALWCKVLSTYPEDFANER